MNSQKLIDNFSTHLKNTIARAISLAGFLSTNQVQPVHMLAALIKEEGAIGADILKRLEMTYESILIHIAPELEAPTSNDLKEVDTNIPELSQATRDVLEKALLLGYNRGHNYIGTEHLLYGLLVSPDTSVRDIFIAHEISYKDVEQALETAFQNTSKFTDIDEMTDVFEHIQEEEAGQQPPNASIGQMKNMMKPKQKQITAVEQFTTLLTSKKKCEKLDPVIGREKEIERMIHVLGRRNKNNPILVGEPGVGKTAIVEGFAKRIAEGNVPDMLKRKKIISLDLTLLIAGTIYRGEFEARLKQIIDEVSEDPDYILFVDELHNIIGAGSNQGTLDAANILKPALARGQLRCIGATTYDEYKKYIAADPALERRFEMIHVDEPTVEETLEILKGIRRYYEDFHKVRIEDEALQKAVELSSKYIHDKFQPDKSIDIVDEAASKVRGSKKSSSREKKYFALLTERDSLIEQKEKAIEEERLKEAMQLKKRIERLDARIVHNELELKEKSELPLPVVTAKEIALTISTKLSIEPDVVMQNEWEQLEQLEGKLKKNIIGQDAALKKIVETLQQSYIGYTRERKPFASFLFVGPSGVGKTELTKVLAQELFHDEKALTKLDMSEFSEAHSVSKILGAPAGYVGFKERNPLLDAIRKRPYSVVVLDEIDKAHPDVRKLLLQMLDEGSITDSGGKKTSLSHAIIILTTNIGAELFKTSGIGFGSSNTQGTELEKTINGRLKEELGSPLLSRLDQTILFRPLTSTDVELIIKNHVALINKALAKKQAIKVKVDATALSSIIREHYNTDLGARNIPRSVERILNQLLVRVLKEKPQPEKNTFTLTHKPSGYSLK